MHHLPCFHFSLTARHQPRRAQNEFSAELNAQLLRNEKAHRELSAAAEQRESKLQAQVTDLEEQLRDLTFHFEAQLKILREEGGSAELCGGDVSAPEAPRGKGKRRAKGAR